MAFDPFGDYEERGYLRNLAGEKDAERVKRLEHGVFRARVGEALGALRTNKPLTYDDLLCVHRTLFGEMYPWAGQDRVTTAPRLNVGKGGRFDLFADPHDIRRAAERALAIGNEAAKMRTKPGEVMGLLAHAHPFLEGNSRAIMTLHAELCRRAGIRVAWEDVPKRNYLFELTRELDHPGRVLDAYLAPHVRRPAATVAQDAKQLRALAGLGPAEEGTQAGGTPAASRPLARTGNPALDVAAALNRPPPAADAPWDPAHTPFRDRLAAFEAKKAKEAAKKATPGPGKEAEPSPGLEQSPAPPKPSGGPGPGF